MASAKELFDIKTPEIHGVVEKENEVVALDEYSKAVEKELKGEPEKKVKAKNKKVDAYRLTVRGNVRDGEKAVSYSVSFVMPRCEDEALQYHAQRFVVVELCKAGKLGDGVLTRYIDEIEETTLELSFFGKDVFALTKDEIQYACDYYGITGCGYDSPSLRNLQKEFYKKYVLANDPSLQDQFAKREFITKIDSVLDYKKLPKITLSE